MAFVLLFRTAVLYYCLSCTRSMSSNLIKQWNESACLISNNLSSDHKFVCGISSNDSKCSETRNDRDKPSKALMNGINEPALLAQENLADSRQHFDLAHGRSSPITLQKLLNIRSCDRASALTCNQVHWD